MSFLRLLFCCLTIYSVSEGRIVQGIIGQNASLLWTFSIIMNDAIYILHNGSPIHRFFPNNKSSVPRKPPHRGSFTVDYTTDGDVTVTIHFLNITKDDAGTYRVVRQWNLEDLDDNVDLQTTEINHYTTTAIIRKEDTEIITHYTTMATTQKENTEEISYYTATAMSRKEDTEGISHYTTAAVNQKGINHYTTAAVIPEVDVEDFPTKRHFLYIVLGMGGILAVACIACLLHKIRICSRVDRVSTSIAFTNSNTDDGNENIQEENLAGNYWTIVSNERGELSTAIEKDFEPCSEPPAITQTIVPTNNESEEILRPNNITMIDKFDGYLNPVNSCPEEFDDYIHPVHSCPVEFDEYIHPVHSDPVNSDFVSTHQST